MENAVCCSISTCSCSSSGKDRSNNNNGGGGKNDDNDSDNGNGNDCGFISVGSVNLPSDIMPSYVKRFVERDEKRPFINDADYFEAVLACHAVSSRAWYLQAGTQAVYSSRMQFFGQPSSDLFQSGRLLKEQLDQLEIFLDQKRKAILGLTKNVPLIESFLDTMGASTLEAKVFYFVLISRCEWSSSWMESTDDRMRGRLLTAKQVYERFSHICSLSELMAITDPKTKWVKERIFESCHSDSGHISAMSKITLRVLTGLPITAEQYLEIDSKCIQETLLKSDKFANSEVGQAIKKEKSQLTSSGEDGKLGNPVLRSELAERLEKTKESSTAGGAIFRVIGEMQEQTKEESPEPSAENVSDDEETESLNLLGPYSSELDYLEDQFSLIDNYTKIQATKTNGESDEMNFRTLGDMRYDPETGRRCTKEQMELKLSKEAEKLELKGEKLKERIASRVLATKSQRNTVPRLEQLCDALDLSFFERFVVLKLMRRTIDPHANASQQIAQCNKVEDFIGPFSKSLETKMKCRASFYKSAALVKEDIITLSGQDFSNGLNECGVTIDRRMVDWLAGVDMELSEIVDGSHLYTPSVSVDDVVLPADVKNRICECASNYEEVKAKFIQIGTQKKISYGLGHVLLFYGKSGTGKVRISLSDARMGKIAKVSNAAHLNLCSSDYDGERNRNKTEQEDSFGQLSFAWP